MQSSTRQLSPDVVVTDLDVTTPSATVGGTPTLAPVNHVIIAVSYTHLTLPTIYSV